MCNRLFGGESATQTVSEVDVVGAQTLQQGASLIDVREPEEFAAGHATGARHILLGQIGSRTGEINTGTTVPLVCCSGHRSRSAQGLLRRHGIADTRNLWGGMIAWHAAGLPEQ